MPNITDGCSDFLTCDIHYELSYEIYLRMNFTCEELTTADPCFGTYACICDNGFTKISKTMPEEIPETYEGYASDEVVVELLIEEE